MNNNIIKMFLIVGVALLVGAALATLYLFLVMRFTSSYDRVSMLFFPIPFLLGVCIFCSFAYNQKIVGILAIVCTIVFFWLMMSILKITFSRVYAGVTLPKVYEKNYHEISEYKTYHLKGEKYLFQLPENFHFNMKGIYLNLQNELIVHGKEYSTSYSMKYNLLGERISENDTLEIQLNAPNIFEESSQRFPKQEETLKRMSINPLYVESYRNKDGEYETILYFDIKTHLYTFRLKTKFSYIKNQEELSKKTTTYYTNDTETIESFGTISVYTNKHLHYQLLKIRDRFYMIKE